MSAVEAFCDRWYKGELALLGSVLRGDSGPDRDIDVLIRFKPEVTPDLLGMAEMQQDLADQIARKVDLVSRSAIENSQNHLRRKAILETVPVVCTS